MAFQSIFEPFEQQASPFTANDTLGTMFTAPKKKKRQRRQGQAATAAEKSALRKIGEGTLSGLATAGATLDTPAGAIRNILTGKAPSIDPFSFEGRSSGRDVLQNYLPIPKNIEGFHPIDEPLDALLDVAGLATEIGLDPLTYTTFGGAAVGRAGKAIQRAGLWDFVPEAAAKYGTKATGEGYGRMAARQNLTPKKLLASMPSDIRKVATGKLKSQADQLGVPLKQMWNEPLGGALAFWPTQTAIGKAGGIGGKVAKALDPIAEAVRYGKYSPMRASYAMFSPAMEGRTLPTVQKQLQHTAAKSEFRIEAIKQKWHGRIAEAAALGHIGEGMEAVNHARKDRMFGELGEDAIRLDNPRMEEIMRETVGEGKGQLTNEQWMGLATEALDDLADLGYMRRGRLTFATPLVPGQKGLFGTKHSSMTGRKNVLKGSPIGSEFPNRLSLDKAISGTATAAEIGPRMSAATRQNLIKDVAARQGTTVKEATEIVRDLFPRTSKKAVDLDAAVKHIYANYKDELPENFTKEDVYQLAQTVSEFDPRYSALQIPIFAHHPLIDSMERELLGQKATANAETVYDLIAKFAKPRREMPLDESRMSITEALEQSDLVGDASHKQMLSRIPKLLDETRSGLMSDKTVLDNIYIPQNVAADVIGLGKMLTSTKLPDTVMGQVGKFYDSWLNFFRGHVTSYWPAFMTRNLMSGQIQNQIGGAYGKNPFGRTGMAASLNDALHAIAGKDIPNVLDFRIVKDAGITDPTEATRLVITKLSAGGLGGRQQTEFAAHMSKEATATAKELLSEIVGTHPFSLKETFGKLIPRKGTRNPLTMRGVGGNEETKFFLSQFGNDMGWAVETLNRYAPALSMMRRGIDPSEAIKRVKLLQVDYVAQGVGDKYMRRMIPFWAFLKGQSEYLAKELTQRPGGGVAQTIRAESWLGREAAPQVLPDWLQQSATIPVGESPEGDPRLLTSLGMMHEDPLQFLATKKGSLPETLGNMAVNAGRELLGRTNPLVKTFLEPVTGTSTWQYGPRGGRNVEDMYGNLGGIASKVSGKKVKLPSWAENVPQLVGLGRYASTIGQVIHEDREWWVKAINVGAGPRVTTVKPYMQEKVIQDELDEKKAKLGAKQFTNMYFPRKYMEQLSPEERQKRVNLQALDNALRRMRKERSR